MATLDISAPRMSELESYAPELTDEIFLETEEEDGADAFPIPTFTIQIISEAYQITK
jgi:hypothetical protein